MLGGRGEPQFQGTQRKGAEKGWGRLGTGRLHTEHPGHIVLVPGMSGTCKLSSCSCDNPLATSQTHRAYASPEQAHYNCRRRLQSLHAPQALPVRGGSAACRQLGEHHTLRPPQGHRTPPPPTSRAQWEPICWEGKAAGGTDGGPVLALLLLRWNAGGGRGGNTEQR